MPMEIIHNTDSKELLEQASFHLAEILKTYINQATPVLLMTSGGSNLQLLGKLTEDSCDKSITISVVDDRFTRDTLVNNFLQMQTSDFYTHCKIGGSGFIDSVPQAGESLEELSMRIESHILQWRSWNPNGKIVATLGMGADGHTAGIAPMSDQDLFYNLFWDTKRLAVGYESTLEPPKRVTVTARFLVDQVDTAIGYVVGKQKQQAFDTLLGNTGWWHEYPVRIWKEMKEIKIFTDLHV